jgi:O-antigen/teichoic acid export membrane protein
MVLLVPFVGLVGTALATLIMYISAFGIYASLTATRIYVLEWLSISIRPALIVLFIGVGLLILDPPTIVKWMVGILLYGILIAIFGGMRSEDIRSIRQIIHQDRKGDDAYV